MYRHFCFYLNLRTPVLCLFVVLTAALVGCGKSDGGGAQQNEGLLPEGVSVRQAFAGSGPSYENPVNEVLKLVQAGSDNPAAYVEAIPQLQRLASNPTISPEQKQALEALLAKLKSDPPYRKAP